MSAKISDSCQSNDSNPTIDPTPVADPDVGAVDPEPEATASEPAVFPWTESENERRKGVERFNKRRAELEPHEKSWMERYHMLLAQGFQLRPRLRPDWQPSWTAPGGNGNAILSEDGEMLRVRPYFVRFISLDTHDSSISARLMLSTQRGFRMASSSGSSASLSTARKCRYSSA